MIEYQVFVSKCEATSQWKIEEKKHNCVKAIHMSLEVLDLDFVKQNN